MRLEEIGDGHCGIRGLWRQFDEVGTASFNSGQIRKGRDKLASALRTHSRSIVKVLVEKYGGNGGISFDEIEDRAKLHETCDAETDCDSCYHVGGFFSLDLIAWAMETKQAVYMIRKDCVVEVFEPFKPPIAIELKNASPSREATVLEYTKGHFNSVIRTPEGRGALSKNHGSGQGDVEQ